MVVVVVSVHCTEETLFTILYIKISLHWNVSTVDLRPLVNHAARGRPYLKEGRRKEERKKP